jgi:hypothetical protein
MVQQYSSQYKTMGSTTNIDDILDLDDEEDISQSRQISSKFIRQKHRPQITGSSNYGSGPQMGAPPGNLQQGGAQNMISSLHPADPRYKQQQMQQNQTLQPSANRGRNSVEQYEEISIQGVSNRIFPTTSSYIDALDDNDHALHNVAMGLLGDSMPTCDKTIYIVIIIILCIAIACLLYRMNHT